VRQCDHERPESKMVDFWAVDVVRGVETDLDSFVNVILLAERLSKQQQICMRCLRDRRMLTMALVNVHTPNNRPANGFTCPALRSYIRRFCLSERKDWTVFMVETTEILVIVSVRSCHMRGSVAAYQE